VQIKGLLRRAGAKGGGDLLAPYGPLISSDCHVRFSGDSTCPVSRLIRSLVDSCEISGEDLQENHCGVTLILIVEL
jgi:hypothetical protein